MIHWVHFTARYHIIYVSINAPLTEKKKGEISNFPERGLMFQLRHQGTPVLLEPQRSPPTVNHSGGVELWAKQTLKFQLSPFPVFF